MGGVTPTHNLGPLSYHGIALIKVFFQKLWPSSFQGIEASLDKLRRCRLEQMRKRHNQGGTRRSVVPKVISYMGNFYSLPIIECTCEMGIAYITVAMVPVGHGPEAM